MQEGEVNAQAGIEFLSSEPNQVMVADISRLYLSKESDPELLRRALNVSALPQGWKDELRLRARSRQG